MILIILHVCENNVAPTPHPSQFAIWAACEKNFVHNIAAKKKEKKSHLPVLPLCIDDGPNCDNNDMLGWGGPQSRLTISYHK